MRDLMNETGELRRQAVMLRALRARLVVGEETF